MNGGSNSCIGPLNTEGVSLNVNSKGVGDSYDSNSQGMGGGGGVQILDFQWRQKGLCRIGLDCISGLHL